VGELAVTRLLEWLLDLEGIRIGHDAPLTLQWQGPIQAWILLCGALLTVSVIAVTYRRERASMTRWIGLASVRCLLVALVLAVICQPALVLQRNRVEPSHVALLVDASLSMAAKEHYLDDALATSVARGAELASPAELSDLSRLELSTAALLRNDAKPLRTLLSRNGIQLYTFAGTAQSEAFISAEAELDDLVTALGGVIADGPSSDLAGAVREVIQQSRGRRLAAIVLASDGQATEPTGLTSALDSARGRQIPILPLRVGSPVEPRDIDVGPLRAQQSVFVNDLLAVEVEVRVRGLTEPTPITIQLVDERSGLTVATETVIYEPGKPRGSVELRTKPTRTGEVRYRVEVEPLAGEMTVDNNADRVDVVILDDRLNVLYVEGYPRYEYRYLKNAFLREKTMGLSVLLLEADEQFVQEGTDPIRRFPATFEELSRYDVVLFGDVDPRGGWLSAGQMQMLLDFVGEKGGGFGLIAGQRYAPHRYLATPLEKLIPVRIDPEFLGRYETPLSSGYRPVLTPEGRQSRLLRFAGDRAASEAAFEALPELYWIARTLGPKPAASVLAEHPTMQTISGAMPVLVTGRYGAGKLFFQATDDTWRWRKHSGELLHDTYWIQVTRELMEPERVAQDRRFVIRTDRRVYGYGQAVMTRITVLDSDLLAGQEPTLRLVMQDAEGFAVAHFEAQRLSAESNLFDGTIVPPRVGRFTIKAQNIAPRPGERESSAVIRVDKPDLEARRPNADHGVLARIAEATGGRVVALDELDVEFARIKDRSVRIPDDVVEPLWDSKLVLLLFSLMISVEWVLRKVFGML
jgi:uncharacterized membrane protein